MNRKIDAYLSRKAQALDPRALVACESDGPCEQWLLEIAGQNPTGIGSSFGAARSTLLAMLKARRASDAATEK